MTRALGDHVLKMPAAPSGPIWSGHGQPSAFHSHWGVRNTCAEMLPNDVVSNVPDITSTDLTKQDMGVVASDHSHHI